MSKYLRLGIYALLAVLITALWVVSTLTGTGYGWLYAAVGALLLFAMSPSSAVHRPTMARFGWLKTVVAVLVALITIAACILPMDAFPIWNGEDAGHRNQYEVMAEAILPVRRGSSEKDSKFLPPTGSLWMLIPGASQTSTPAL